MKNTEMANPLLRKLDDTFKNYNVSAPRVLARSSTAERPISLTHVLWRQYCRARWNLLEAWKQEYRLQAPWDSAIPGRCSLDVGIRRVLRAEARQLRGANFASIFIDISGFYDNVQWPDLIQDGLALAYPPVLLELCLQVYAGGRLLRRASPEPDPASGIWPASRVPPGTQHLQNRATLSTHRPWGAAPC